MKTVLNPSQGEILYWDWKHGRFVSNLKLVLEYARLHQKHDVYWLELEVAKRNVGGNPHFTHL